ncbi:MAG: hypothetical protein ABMA26_21755 [Limisphaerales bacterium]
MKSKNKVISVIIAVTQSKWISALMTLALLGAVVLNVEGCGSHSH